MESFNRNFAFITGTSSGIGLAVAQLLLSRGWEVWGTSRRDTNIIYENYKHFNYDLSDLGSLTGLLNQELVKKLNNESLNRVAVINNAATGGSMVTLDKIQTDELEKLFILNTIIPIRITSFFLENCKPGINMNVINISSGAAHSAIPGLGAYCISKAALRMASQVFGKEVDTSSLNNKFDNLSFISYEPGTVDTEMQKEARSQSKNDFPAVEMFQSFYENNQLVQPENVAMEITDFVSKNWDNTFVEKRFGG